MISIAKAPHFRNFATAQIRFEYTQKNPGRNQKTWKAAVGIGSFNLFVGSELARQSLENLSMNTQNRSTIVGVFEDHRHANQAITELHKAGFTESQIGVAMRHAEALGEPAVEGSHAGSSALTGALAGLGLGALAGLGVLAGVIPVVGPAIAAGTLGVVFSNAAAGAGIAGLVGALVGAGVPEREAKYYQEQFEAGRTIVTVAAGDRAVEAANILSRNGAHEMRSQAAARAAD